jgi:hypothetical protein
MKFVTPIVNYALLPRVIKLIVSFIMVTKTIGPRGFRISLHPEWLDEEIVTHVGKYQKTYPSKVGISEKKFTLDRILYSSGMTDGIICWSLL